MPSTSSLRRISTSICDQPTDSALVSSSSTDRFVGREEEDVDMKTSSLLHDEEGVVALEIVGERNGAGQTHGNSISISGTHPSVQRRPSLQRESTGTSITSSTPQPEQTMPEPPRPPQAFRLVRQRSLGIGVVYYKTPTTTTSTARQLVRRASCPSLGHPSEPPVAPASAQNESTRRL